MLKAGPAELQLSSSTSTRRIFNGIVSVVSTQILSVVPSRFAPNSNVTMTIYASHFIDLSGPFRLSLCGPYATHIYQVTPTYITFTVEATDYVIETCRLWISVLIGGDVVTIATTPDDYLTVAAPFTSGIASVMPRVIFQRTRQAIVITGHGLATVSSVLVAGLFECEIASLSSTELRCFVVVCDSSSAANDCIPGEQSVAVTLKSGAVIASAILAVDPQAKSPFDPSVLYPDSDLDYETQLYMSTTDFLTLYPPSSTSAPVLYMQPVVAHDSFRRSADCWTETLIRVDFVPGSFNPYVPFSIFFNDYYVPIVEIDALGYMISIPACEYDAQGEVICICGQNGTLTARDDTGQLMPAWLPVRASHEITRRAQSETTSTLYPPSAQLATPDTFECGDTVDYRIHTRGVFREQPVLAFFLSDDSFPTFAAELQARGAAFAAAGEDNSASVAGMGGAGVPTSATVSASSALRDAFAQAALWYRREVAALAAARSGELMGRTLVARLADSLGPRVSTLFARAPTTLLTIASGAAVPSDAIIGALHATMSSMTAFEALLRTPAYETLVFNLVLSDQGRCRPSKYDVFLYDLHDSLVEVDYAPSVRGKRVIHNPFYGVQYGFAWLEPLPSREADVLALTNSVIEVLAASMRLGDLARLIAMPADVDSAILYVGLLPRRRNTLPTPAQMSSDIDRMLIDQESLLRRKIPQIDARVFVPPVELRRCPPRDGPDDAVEYNYQVHCDAASDPGTQMSWYMFAVMALGVLLVVLLVAVLANRYSNCRPRACARACPPAQRRCCECCKREPEEQDSGFYFYGLQ
jgi:hypothetical protein